MRRRLACLSLLAFFLVLSAGRAAGEETAPATARLVAEHATLAPGVATRVGVRFAIREGWHLYWRNPGDAGTRPHVRWLLPEGFVVSELAWPAPARKVVGGLAAYQYEGEVLLAATVTPPEDFRGEARLRVLADWLVCDEDCVPGRAALELTLPVRAGPPRGDAATAALFDRTEAALPRPLPEGHAVVVPDGSALRLAVDGLPVDGSIARVDFFPYAWDVVELAAPPTWVGQGDGIRLSLPRLPGAAATHLDGVLVVEGGDGRRAFRIGEAHPMPVETTTEARWQEARTPAVAGPVDVVDYETFGGVSAGGPSSLLWALLAAFVGGLILNLMPCVLPVLSLKVLGFVSQAGDDPRRVRAHGLAFGLGVVLAFQALAGLLLLLRAGGEQLGWGFQLQEPAFVAAMAFLFVILAMNLLGFFEIGQGVQAVAGRAQAKVSHGGLGASFANGLLATAIATPCTAPFMGGALGFTLDKSPGVALGVFATLGAGMAAPYVLLAFFPRWLARVPRPGPWMEVFRRVMAVPLLATAAWLGWVFAQQRGPGGALFLVAGLVLAALGLFVHGRLAGKARGGRAPVLLGRAMPALLLLAGVWVASLAPAAVADEEAVAAGAPSGGGLWVPFDAARIEALRRQGRPVFVDFTADWCLTCKFNERTFIDVPRIHALVERHGFVMMKADWTRKDPSITEALARFRRASVPLYVLYRPDPEARPVVLPEAITTGRLAEAMNMVAGDRSAGNEEER